ncbi:MAG: hypothetical protein ACR2KV_02735 [Solirubrobacteraceae bacterium]
MALPGLPETECGSLDVCVEVTRAQERPRVDSTWTTVGTQPGVWRAPAAGGSRLRLQFEGGAGSWGDFLIDERGEIVRLTLDWSSDLDDACELLIASVFSCVLAQRGLTCLHASVVEIEDRVIALVGPKGAGKSTLALALARRGGRLLSDDVAAVSWLGGICQVAVGRAALRMRPDSAAGLGVAFTARRPVWAGAPPSLGKRYYAADEPAGPAPRRVPLAGVFLLAPRGTLAAPEVRSVPPGVLLPALLSNRHMATALDRAGHRRDFACLGALVGQVPGRELHRPDDLATAAAAAEAVAAAAGRLSGPTAGEAPTRRDGVV